MTAISRPAGSAPPGGSAAAITWLSGIARVFEYRLLSYRRTLRASLFNSFVDPALFLAALGVGLGTGHEKPPGFAALFGPGAA